MWKKMKKESKSQKECVTSSKQCLPDIGLMPIWLHRGGDNIHRACPGSRQKGSQHWQGQVNVFLSLTKTLSATGNHCKGNFFLNGIPLVYKAHWSIGPRPAVDGQYKLAQWHIFVDFFLFHCFVCECFTLLILSLSIIACGFIFYGFCVCFLCFLLLFFYSGLFWICLFVF